MHLRPTVSSRSGPNRLSLLLAHLPASLQSGVRRLLRHWEALGELKVAIVATSTQLPTSRCTAPTRRPSQPCVYLVRFSLFDSLSLTLLPHVIKHLGRCDIPVCVMLLNFFKSPVCDLSPQSDIPQALFDAAG